MNTNRKLALEVLNKNYHCLEESFIYEIYHNSKFDKQLFWNYYDCIMVLAEEALKSGKDIEIAMKISKTYERMLKEIIWHFDKNDGAEIKNLPENYVDYIDRIDAAVNAYFSGVFEPENNFLLER